MPFGWSDSRPPHETDCVRYIMIVKHALFQRGSGLPISSNDAAPWGEGEVRPTKGYHGWIQLSYIADVHILELESSLSASHFNLQLTKNLIDICVSVESIDRIYIFIRLLDCGMHV